MVYFEVSAPRPNKCLISNGLSTMAFAFPGAIGAKHASPERKVLAGADAGFLMNSQELETAVREKIPVVVLIWVDGSYGLIKWKMDIELGRHSHVDFETRTSSSWLKAMAPKATQ